MRRFRVIPIVAVLALSASGCAGWGGGQPDTSPRAGWVTAGTDPGGREIRHRCDQTTLVKVFAGKGLAIRPNASDCAGDPARPLAGGRWLRPFPDGDPTGNSIIRRCDGTVLLYFLPAVAVAAEVSPHCDQKKASPDLRVRTQWVPLWDHDSTYTGLPVVKRCFGSTLVYRLGERGLATLDNGPDCDANAPLNAIPIDGWVPIFGEQGEQAVYARCFATLLVFALRSDALALRAKSPVCLQAPPADAGSQPTSSPPSQAPDPTTGWVETMGAPSGAPIYRRCLDGILVLTLTGRGLGEVPEWPECSKPALTSSTPGR